MNHLAEKLNRLLSDYQIFYQNLRGFHWNIQGRNFFELHVKFEELYKDAAVKIDEVFERILTTGGTPLHDFQDYLNQNQVSIKKNIHDGEAAAKSISETLFHWIALEKEIKAAAVETNDHGTGDLMSDIFDEQEKTLWMYNAWLK
jgi:starvation-inducible DNA-binding protein